MRKELVKIGIFNESKPIKIVGIYLTNRGQWLVPM